MKKSIFIALFCILSHSFMAQSQTNNTNRRVVIGVNIGPSIDWLSPRTVDYKKDGTILGLRYGIPVDINFTEGDNYYFSTGLKFAHSGGELLFTGIPVEYPESTTDIHRKYRTLYMSIPTGVKLKTPSFSNFVIGGNFGLEHGFLLSSKHTDVYYMNGKEIKDQSKQEHKEALFFRESVYIGPGVEYIIKNDLRVSFYINYSYTISNFFKKKAKNDVTAVREKGHLGAVEFLFGFSF